MEPNQIASVAHTIQLAVAPVFLLTAVGTILGALVNRLGRIVDRRRQLEKTLHDLRDTPAEEAHAELHTLLLRARLIYHAITLAVLSGLFVCLLVASAFIGSLILLDISFWVAGLFILAMLALTGCLGMLLREVFLAVGTARRAIR